MIECKVTEASGECLMCGSTEEAATVEFKDAKPAILCFTDFRKAWKSRTTPKKQKKNEARTVTSSKT